MSSSREFGLTLPLAHLAPDFISQVFESPLVSIGDGVMLPQLDDLRSWLRDGGRKASDLASEVADAITAGEREANEAASLDGATLDRLDFELDALSSDPEADLLDSASIKPVVQLIVEEADSLQAWSLKDIGLPFCASLSFELPQPARHPVLKPLDLAEALAKHGGGALTGQVDPELLSGVINLDLVSGEEVPPAPGAETGVIRVNIDDPRAGDTTRLQISFFYPRAMEAYFLATFDALRKSLLLK